ncbi:MAG: hypothetical protein JRD89_20385 [Deltaproteobacteria bacterium]|nr:hypothetical protein [Deltaproteobacteria bacterium]
MEELTETQKLQIRFLEATEPLESLARPPVIWAECKTCKVSKEFRSADGARSFILNHKGHNTWIQHCGACQTIGFAVEEEFKSSGEE